MLKTSLLGDELDNKVYIALSFFLSVRVPEPRRVLTEVEFSDRVDAWTKKGFENDLTNVLIDIFIVAEIKHV